MSPPIAGSPAYDPRHLPNGRVIPSSNFADQPYVVVLSDGSWLCVLTTGAGEEGDAGQHIVALRSFDKGHLWQPPITIEPPHGPEASCASPLYVPEIGGPLGRIYVFYVYNRDNLREVLADGNCKFQRVDTLGYYVFRYSDDGGQTWSPERYEVPVREFAIDRENPYQGKVRFFWSVCKPLISQDQVFLGIHKVGSFGQGFMSRSEGCFVVSNNILTEPDPSKIIWQTLPDGDVGLRATHEPIADEHNITALSDSSLFCTYRTIEGSPCHAYSRDGGHTWTAPTHMTYGPSQRKVKHPRAANFVRRFSNGKFLYWFHNHGLKSYEGRNPVWLLGGEEIDSPEGRVIQWSQPELVLYDDDINSRISYPDFIEQDGDIFLTETQKTIGRVHQIPELTLKMLWEAPHKNQLSQRGLALDIRNQSTCIMPKLPDLWEQNAGFTLDFKVKFDDLTPNQILFDSRNQDGNGLLVTLTEQATLKLSLTGPITTNSPSQSNCSLESSWECDTDVIRTGDWHKVTVIVDGGPKLILWVVDELLCDGNNSRPFGWGRFNPALRDVNGAKNAKIAFTLRGSMEYFRIYSRVLYVNEAASNHRATNSPR
jgi:hypothetical protein